MKKRLRITDGESKISEHEVEMVYLDDSKYELRYDEDENSSVAIKVGKGTLCLNRKSEGIETILFFKEDQRISGKAKTIYGDVELQTFTTYLDMKDDFIRLEYTVEGDEDTQFSYHWEILEVSNESN